MEKQNKIGTQQTEFDLRMIRIGSLLINVVGFCIAILLWLRTPYLYSQSTGFFRNQYIVLDSFGTLLAIAILLMTYPALLSYKGAMRVANFFASHRILIAVSTTLLLCAGSIYIYHLYPTSMDEYAPWFQSKVFAEGKLAATFSPSLINRIFLPQSPNQFFSISYVNGKVISHYWPGFTLLLTPFMKLHVAWLLNPLLAFGSLLLLGKITKEIFDSNIAGGLAILFAIASPAFTINAISLYSMNAHLFFNLAFVALLLRPTGLRILSAGFVGSVAVILHNPFPHLLFALPWIVWLAVRPRRIRNLFLLGIGYLPLTLGVGIVWVLFNEVVVNAGTFSFGSFSVQEILNLIVARGEWLAIPSFRLLEIRFLCLVKLCSWAVPGLLLLALYGGWRWREKPVIQLLMASAILTFFGYFGVKYSQGQGWGYRYFHSAWGVLPILGAGALIGNCGNESRWRTHLTSFAVTAALLSLVLGNTMRAVQVEHLISRRFSELPAVPAKGSSACFINIQHTFFAGDLLRNDPFFRNRVLYFISYGQESDEQFIKNKFPAAHLFWSGPKGSGWSLDSKSITNRTR